jgi:single-strand DNA-binding protein
MNKAILIGRLGKDPESRFTQTNTQVVNFSIATSKKVKGEEQTEWHNIVAFSKTAEIAQQYLTKGSLVCVEGSITTSQYEKNGEKRYSTQIICDRLEMLGGMNNNDNKDRALEQKPGSQKVDISNWDQVSDDLPF